MTPFLLSTFSKTEYGIYVLVIDVLGWLAITNIGTAPVLKSVAAQRISKNETSELNKDIINSLVIQAIAIVVILIITPVLFCYLDILGSFDKLTDFIFIIVIGFIIQFSLQPLEALLIANKEIATNNLLKIISLLLQNAIIVLFVHLDLGIFSLAWGSFASNVLIFLITLARIRSSFPNLSLSHANVNIDTIKFIVKKGIFFSIGGLAGLLITRLDSWLIAKYISLETLAVYYVTLKLFRMASKITAIFVDQYRPEFAYLIKSGTTKMNELFYALYIANVLLSMLVNVCLYFLCDIILRFWIGPDFFLGTKITGLIALNYFLQSTVLVPRAFLASTMFRLKQHNVSRILEGVIKLVTSLLLVRWFDLSGLLLSSIFCSVFISNWYLLGLVNSVDNNLQSNITTYFFVSLLIVLVMLVTNVYLALFLFLLVLSIVRISGVFSVKNLHIGH